MTLNGDGFMIKYDSIDQEVNFIGSFRATKMKDLDRVSHFLKSIHEKIEGMIRLNFRRLKYINSAGLQTILNFLKYSHKESDANIELVVSNVLSWSEKSLIAFTNISDNINYRVHDENFYGSQDIIEDQGFIPLLRNQTRLLWPFEKEIFKKHGLAKGMKVADICCGCGDTSLLIAKEFAPEMVLGIDHSVAGVEFALQKQNEFKVFNADFKLGDATSLMLDDNTFDFVICRLSIQIFSQPEQIFTELYRIVKPGGRIYVTGEDYDLIIGYPNYKIIREVYDKSGHYGSELGIDMYNGKKLYSQLRHLKLKDLLLDQIVVDTANSDRVAFTQMVKSWKFFCSESLGTKLNLDDEDCKKLLDGYDKHIKTINHPYGYSTWGIVAASGVK